MAAETAGAEGGGIMGRGIAFGGGEGWARFGAGATGTGAGAASWARANAGATIPPSNNKALRRANFDDEFGRSVADGSSPPNFAEEISAIGSVIV